MQCGITSHGAKSHMYVILAAHHETLIVASLTSFPIFNPIQYDQIRPSRPTTLENLFCLSIYAILMHSSLKCPTYIRKHSSPVTNQTPSHRLLDEYHWPQLPFSFARIVALNLQEYPAQCWSLAVPPRNPMIEITPSIWAVHFYNMCYATFNRCQALPCS